MSTRELSFSPGVTQFKYPHFRSPSKLYEIVLLLVKLESGGPVNQKTASVPSGLNLTSIIKTPLESYSNMCVISKSS